MVRVEFYNTAIDKDSKEVWECENISKFLVAKKFTKEELLDLRFFNSSIFGNEISTDNPDFLDTSEGDITIIKSSDIPGATAVVIGVIAFAVSFAASYFFAKQMKKPNMPQTTASRKDPARSATNSLAESTNETNLGGRIDDVLGFVGKHTPPLWQSPYRIGINDREVEVLLCCVGRGKYEINTDQVFDGITRMKNIPNAAVDFYEPGTHPGKGSPYLQIGNGIDEPIGAYYESNDLDSSELLPPNDLTLGSGASWSASADGTDLTLVLTNAESLNVDLQDYFAVDSTCSLIECVVAGTGDNVTLYNSSGDPTTYTMNRINLSGDYTILSVTNNTIVLADVPYTFSSTSFLTSVYRYTSENLVPFYYSTATYNGLYTTYDEVEGVSDPVTATNTSLDSDVGQTFDNILGPFILKRDADGCLFILSSTNGFYKIDENNYKSVSSNVRVVIEELDDNDSPTGNTYTDNITYASHVGNVTSSVYRSYRYDKIYDNARIYLRRTTNRDKSDNVSSIDEIEWTLLYSFESVDVENLDLGDVTLAHSLVVNNSQSRLTKKRKFNLDVTRKITQYQGEGVFSEPESVPSRKAGEIAIHAALDPYIGRLTVDEIDADGILDIQDQITEYFDDETMCEFGHDFDALDFAFSDTFAVITDAINCLPYVRMGVYSMYFEQPQSESVMQLVGRDKKQGSEQRKDILYNEYDSVEVTFRQSDGTNYTIYIPEDRSGTNPDRITLDGVFNNDQAYRRAWRERNKQIYQTQQITFDAGEIGRMVTPGMRIDTPDSTRYSKRENTENGYRIYEGEVVEVNGLVVELSEPIHFQSTERHYIQFSLADGSNSKLLLCIEGDDEFSVVLQELPEEPIYDGYQKNKTKYTFFSEQYQESMAMLLSSIESRTDEDGIENNTMIGVNYSASYYKDDMRTF